MSENVILVEDFTKKYGDFTAVDGISFSVSKGEVFGLLGPNGAGKTSTLESLEGLRNADAGKLLIAGVDPAKDGRQLRNRIGVQLQSSGLPDSITVSEAMKFFSSYHGTPVDEELIDRMGLREKVDTQYFQLSTGQKRRLALALAIAHHPDVLFLDEPTAGLDVPSRNELHKLINELKQDGTTILLATHDMAEAEELADRIAILLDGKIAAAGTPMEVTATGRGLTKVSVRVEGSSLEGPVVFPGVAQSLVKDEYRVYYSTDIGPTVSAIIGRVQGANDRLIDLRVERPSLEDRFLEITNIGDDR
jgi:ABC-2 type transport system ATP-binding protein